MLNVLSPRDLVFRPDKMDETVLHTTCIHFKESTDRNVHDPW